jgi:hypothetical protein
VFSSGGGNALAFATKNGIGFCAEARANDDVIEDNVVHELVSEEDEDSRIKRKRWFFESLFYSPHTLFLPFFF